MPETVTECMLCGSRESLPFDRRTFRGVEVTNRLCRNCGLVYQSPRMTEAEAAVFYQAEYRRLYQGQEGPIARDLSAQKGRAGALVRFACATVREVHSHLDIGCSSGMVLQHFQQAYGCTSTGVEPGDAYRQFACGQGLTVYPTLSELEGQSQGRFQLISMSHVLEHISMPVEYLTHLREHLLEPEGWLLLEVPNLYAHDSFEPAHQIAFSAHTLGETVRKAGFKVVRLKEHGEPRSTVLPLYLSLLAKPAGVQSFILSPEKSVALKRKAAMLRRHFLERVAPHQAWLPIDTRN